jgi:hypothetical protein
MSSISTASLAHIRSKADFIAALIKESEDALHPHVFSNAHVELFVSDVVKHTGAAVADKALSAQVLDLSHKMAAQASASLLSAFDPGDELCPPWRWPGPRPLSEIAGPYPDPWQPISSAGQVELAYILTNLAGLTSSKEFNNTLKSLATSIARGAASQLADDFEKCGTKPRKPFPPRPNLTAGETRSTAV